MAAVNRREPLECPICYECLVPTVEATEGTEGHPKREYTATAPSSAVYISTVCSHYFHEGCIRCWVEKCIEDWQKVPEATRAGGEEKDACPNCEKPIKASLVRCDDFVAQHQRYLDGEGDGNHGSIKPPTDLSKAVYMRFEEPRRDPPPQQQPVFDDWGLGPMGFNPPPPSNSSKELVVGVLVILLIVNHRKINSACHSLKELLLGRHKPATAL
ncbi:MAG: hypothetical protein KDK76_01610 [Chlamydiia bacterium]|nr:hypothetical protein [Chlamydiia bacterium]